MKLTKRVLAMILAVAMIVGMVAVGAFAEDDGFQYYNWDPETNPYTAKIIKQSPQYYAKYEKELEQIHSLFDMDSYTSKERLDAKFFMGFYCQKQDFYKKTTDVTEE